MNNFIYGFILGIIAVFLIAGFVMGIVAFFKVRRLHKMTFINIEDLTNQVNQTKELIYEIVEEKREELQLQISNLKSTTDSRFDKLQTEIKK
jgi:multisubunit Na+/H+ antiporter MnhE subunit